MEKLNVTIRRETPGDWRAVEVLTREAFWNLYAPGCDEHYLAHILREDEAFVPELDFVAEADGTVVGNIMFSRSYILTAGGEKVETVTFGPLSVLPAYHNRGVGGALVRHGIKAAAEMGLRAVTIFGYPGYYSRFGFRPAKEFGISAPDGRYPVAHQVLELYQGALDGVSGMAFEAGVFQVDREAAEAFDKNFAPKEKRVEPSQQLFAETAASFWEE